MHDSSVINLCHDDALHQQKTIFADVTRRRGKHFFADVTRRHGKLFLLM